MYLINRNNNYYLINKDNKNYCIEYKMYATIKGTLTENDGVFSGFSATNSLEIQGLYDFSKPFEIKTKIHINSNPNASSFIKIAGSSTGYAVIMIGTGLVVGVYMSANDGTSLFSGNVTPTNSIPMNTDVFLKFVFTGTEYAIYVSTDENIYTKYLIATTSKVIGSNKNILLGANPSASQSFAVGTIDLNKTNIKLGSTKYNLQAVVGYTIVGSPTIVDGVVSGFSENNYLKLGGTIKYSGTSNLEFYFRFKTATTMSGFTNVLSQGYSVGSTYKWRTIAQYGTTSTCSAGYDISGSSIEFYKALQPDTWYRVKFYAENGIWVNETYNDDGALFGSANKNIDFAEIERDFYIGANQDNQSVFIQAVDLNVSYIKKYGKLWFNGQQA